MGLYLNQAMSVHRIIVTGGAGFIGSAYIRYLVKNAQYQILNIDKLTYAGNLESLDEVSSSENYSFKKIDICDLETLKSVFISFKPTIVVHFAAESHVDRSIDNPASFINTNIVGTYNLLEASYNYYSDLSGEEKNFFRFHHVSTDEVYGDLGLDDEPFTENHCYAPSSPYSASKASSDHLVRAWYRTFKLPVIISNCSNNYGPFQFPEKLIPVVINNALEGKKIPIYGNGQQIRDWLYVDDHVRALLEIELYGEVGQTYNIGGNSELTNLDLVKQVCLSLDKLRPNTISLATYFDLVEFVQDRSGHDFRYAIDNTKILKELNWRPKETISSGIHKTVSWYLKNSAWTDRVKDGSYMGERLGVLKN